MKKIVVGMIAAVLAATIALLSMSSIASARSPPRSTPTPANSYSRA